MFKIFGILLITGFACCDQRIAGGDLASIGQFPYHAHIQKYVDGVFYMCGGSIVRYNWVITSATCVQTWEYIQVYMGLNDKQEGPVSRFAHIENLDHVRTHPDYIPPNQISANIAMLYLEHATPDWIDYRLDVIHLPEFGDVENSFVNMMAVATGFGMTSDEPGSGTSRFLRFVNMTVIWNQQCASYFGGIINENKICTETFGGRSTCAGDEGGSLVVTLEPDRKVLVGVASFRSGAGCTVDHPAIFTRVTKFLEWINGNLGYPQETTTSTTIQPPTDDNRCICECNCFTCPPLSRDEL